MVRPEGALEAGSPVGGPGVIGARAVIPVRRPGGPHPTVIRRLSHSQGIAFDSDGLGSISDSARIDAAAGIIAVPFQGQLILDVTGRPGARFELFAVGPAGEPVLLGIGRVPPGGYARIFVQDPKEDSPRLLLVSVVPN